MRSRCRGAVIFITPAFSASPRDSRPTIKAKARLTAEGTRDRCRAELRLLYEELNSATDGTLHIDAEYLVTAGRGG